MTKINKSLFVGVLVLLAIASVAPTFAITYTDANNPHGPFQGIAWGVGLGIAGLLAGVGIFTTKRRRH
ncbi:MAG: LPXTG cell wall anchor domain-containing protein [Nitrosotalea sp.]